jgi:hypothetical protein
MTPLTSCFDGEEGGWHQHWWVWVVSPLSVGTSRLEPRKQKKPISKFIKTRNKYKKNSHRAQMTQSSFGPTLHPFAFLQLLAMVVEVGVDLGMPTCEPPCEQMLVGMGQVLWPSSSPPHFLTHPSTLQAVAVVVVPHPPSSPLPIVIPPTNHPMSSCS